ncbi:MAG: hypothetical protein AB8B58_15015 [Roseobacter sp.]
MIREKGHMSRATARPRVSSRSPAQTLVHMASRGLHAGVLTPCDTPEPNDKRSSAPVPTSETVGIYRYICGDRNPEKLQQFPFPMIHAASKTNRHAGFDMAFSVDHGCTIRALISEKQYETSDDGAELVLKASHSSFEKRAATAFPQATVKQAEDGYFLVSLP